MYLCHWHVKRAWMQNLIAKCGKGMPKSVFQRMGEVMAMLKHHDESNEAFLACVQQCMEELYATFADEKSCMEYIQRQWGSDGKLSKLCISHKHTL